MGAAATAAWLEYRAALKSTLEAPDVLGQQPLPPSAPPLDDAIDEALEASEVLETECLAERARGDARRNESEEQLLAGATIDFMLATELAILDAPASARTPVLAAETRRALWQSAVTLADAAFQIRGGGGSGVKNVEPILPRPTPPSAPPKLDPGPVFPPRPEPIPDPSPKPVDPEPCKYRPPPRPPITTLGGGSVQSEDGTIWAQCGRTSAELVTKATGPSTSAVTAIVGPVVGAASEVLALLPDLPDEVAEFVKRAAEDARRALARALKFVLRYARKIAAALGPTLKPALGTALSEFVNWSKPPLATAAIKRLAAFEDYQRGVDERFGGDDGGRKIPMADKRFLDDMNALDSHFKGSLKWFNHMTSFGATFAHLAAAVAGPLLPVAVMGSIVAYIVFLLRRCLETVPDTLQRRKGIPSLATNAVHRQALAG